MELIKKNLLKYKTNKNEYNKFIINNLVNKKVNKKLLYLNEYSINSKNEFLKKFFNYKEINNKLPKYINYYKNYIKFFCQPFFLNFNLNKIITNYGEKKAEIYYNNNYGNKKNKKEKNIFNNKFFTKSINSSIQEYELSSCKSTLNLSNSRLKCKKNDLDNSFTTITQIIKNFNKENFNKNKKLIIKNLNYKKERIKLIANDKKNLNNTNNNNNNNNFNNNKIFVENYNHKKLNLTSLNFIKKNNNINKNFTIHKKSISPFNLSKNNIIKTYHTKNVLSEQLSSTKIFENKNISFNKKSHKTRNNNINLVNNIFYNNNNLILDSVFKIYNNQQKMLNTNNQFRKTLKSFHSKSKSIHNNNFSINTTKNKKIYLKIIK